MQTHLCPQYGAEVDHFATHGLNCHRSKRRYHQLAALNDQLECPHVWNQPASRVQVVRDLMVYQWCLGKEASC